MKSISIVMALGMFLSIGPAWAQGALPAGQADAGATVFKKCMACHRVGPSARNGVGPVLNGVVGRSAGTYAGYTYSAATKQSGLVWDEPTLARYLRSPREVVPGTKMAFVGLKKNQEIADVIAYLKGYDALGKKAGQ